MGLVEVKVQERKYSSISKNVSRNWEVVHNILPNFVSRIHEILAYLMIKYCIVLSNQSHVEYDMLLPRMKSLSLQLYMVMTREVLEETYGGN